MSESSVKPQRLRISSAKRSLLCLLVAPTKRTRRGPSSLVAEGPQTHGALIEVVFIIEFFAKRYCAISS